LDSFEIIGDSRQSVKYAVQPSDTHRLDLMLTGPEATIFKAGQRGELVLWTVPTLGINTWRIETYSGSVRTNTNDGKSAGFSPAAQLELLLQSTRAPPSTLVDVDLTVDIAQISVVASGAPIVPELRIIAPSGFTFPLVCGTICSSPEGLTFAGTGRSMAYLVSGTSTTLLSTRLKFRVTTPKRTPTELIWLVEARGVGGQVVGWGAEEGFKINQMLDTVAMYGSISGLASAQLAFQFTFTTQPGERIFSIIEIQCPSAYFLSCLGTDLNRITLPGGPPSCDLRGFGKLQISLNETLRPGAYAFAVKMSLPTALPEANMFALIVRERTTELIIDGAFELPGKPFVPLPITQPSLAWSTAGFNQRSSVTVGFTFTNTTSNIQALLITLPPGFSHTVTQASDVKSSNAMLPLMKGGEDWIDAVLTNRLRILLEPSDLVIAAGSYRLTFPVLLPETAYILPRWNIWMFSLCGDRNTCLTPEDFGVLVSFPMAGFGPGEVSVLEQNRIQAALDKTLGSGIANLAGRCTVSVLIMYFVLDIMALFHCTLRDMNDM
jgi:hypothetical protein